MLEDTFEGMEDTEELEEEAQGEVDRVSRRTAHRTIDRPTSVSLLSDPLGADGGAVGQGSSGRFGIVAAGVRRGRDEHDLRRKRRRAGKHAEQAGSAQELRAANDADPPKLQPY